jgi:hypothetical protein
MTYKACSARMRLRLSPSLLKVAFLLVNVAIFAAQFQSALPMSERWG